MTVKPTFLNQQNPILCAITECADPASIISDMCNAFADGADAFAIELDRLSDSNKSEDSLRHIFSFAGNKPIYVTNYRQGNNIGKSDERLEKELLTALNAGATLIDVRGDMYDPQPLEMTQDSKAIAKQREFIRHIHERGGEVIMSSHTKCYLPQDQILEIVRAQQERGADFAKIVTFADTYDELFVILSTSVMMKEVLDIPFIILACGRCSKILRITGYMYGSSMVLGVPQYTDINSRIQPTVRSLRTVLSNTYWQQDRV